MTPAQLTAATTLALQFGIRPGDAAYGAVLAAYAAGNLTNKHNTNTIGT